jgi:hypothetical protein
MGVTAVLGATYVTLVLPCALIVALFCACFCSNWESLVGLMCTPLPNDVVSCKCVHRGS